MSIENTADALGVLAACGCTVRFDGPRDGRFGVRATLPEFDGWEDGVTHFTGRIPASGSPGPGVEATVIAVAKDVLRIVRGRRNG